ncbi:hypothetical protein [Rhodanobacter lindaniclasticus]
MPRHDTAYQRADRRRTAAAERATGQFYCSSSGHFATGDPIIVRGRKVCQACAHQRKQALKEMLRD